MNVLSSPRFLPTVLWIDAASCVASGVLQIAVPARVAGLLGLPPLLVTLTGWVLLAAATLAILGARNTARRGVIGLLIAGNVLWVLGCLELLFTAGTPTPLGYAWLAMQAVAVGVLAELEFIGLRRNGLVDRTRAVQSASRV
ncbi:MAG TPA: hypothetical protein VHL79_04685 [Ramlibacter sp.]|jgi:Na+/melibiose symporter-like transporter|nr:hypothetical protein [Ramlibacter sp.]